MIADSLNIPKTVVLRILKEVLRKRMLWAHFGPHSLTPEQRKDRVTSCQDIIAIADGDKFFLNKIIKGDENWCFANDSETKRQSSEWVGETLNAEFYKGVMDRLLKRIQRIHPAVFCSRDFFLLHDNVPAHKAASVCQF